MLVIGADGTHTIITNTFRRRPGVQEVPVPVIWIATRSHFPQPPGFLCCNNIQQYQQSSS